MKTNVKIESIEPKPRKLRNHHALNKLKNYIIENNLKIGDRIPTETELCERFQVSRVSVREATKALSLLGVLKSKPRRGTVLNEPDISGVNELISFHFASANYTKHELLELRLIIEVGQLKYAIDNMTKETYQQCMDIITDLDVENLSRKEWLC